MDGERQATNTATWTQLLKELSKYGVGLAETESKSGFYLRRAVGPTILHFALPSNFDPKNPDAAGLPGPFVIYSIQRNLDLKIEGWYAVL